MFKTQEESSSQLSKAHWRQGKKGDTDGLPAFTHCQHDHVTKAPGLWVQATKSHQQKQQVPRQAPSPTAHSALSHVSCQEIRAYCVYQNIKRQVGWEFWLGRLRVGNTTLLISSLLKTLISPSPGAFLSQRLPFLWLTRVSTTACSFRRRCSSHSTSWSFSSNHWKYKPSAGLKIFHKIQAAAFL